MSRYDEEAKYDRPKRRTRPRTKDRPSYDDAVIGFVTTRDRGRYTCWVGDRQVTAMKARQLGRTGVIVGDQVKLDGNATGDEGTLARIVEVVPRTTLLRRSADDDDPVERPLVANADQLVIVVAVANPEPRTGLIDRFLVAAYDAGMRPLLCLTKTDLADPTPLLDIYRPLGVESVATQQGGNLDALREQLDDRTSVLVGHSGVGKSTLVNGLIEGANRAIGVVNDVTGRGRHTSTNTVVLRLPEGGWIIDTPGIRSFGLAHVEPDKLIHAFPDLADITVDCPRGCTHTELAPDCALDEAVAAGRADADRVTSFRRLFASREGREQKDADPAT
ncbi:ribosome small subunit-dependent GTPase A [Kribbella albertanoniae]|uniref:Small ribosomal subunit biogenesis GTPase RsgA n=1 Tax=Kribbella albertanoniae TaxID=1266829 RepID=A0A4R4PVI8_9ACTN|nr:ribosome small subunit-dependent GTPase A [Kribbella albertanoniae]TDC26442.1 ribosome small subunit-dependent GTPase A [Kribbella albertanoniae]